MRPASGPPIAAAASSARPTATSIASSSRPATCTRSGPNTCLAISASSSGSIDRAEELPVATTAAAAGSSSPSMPATSLSALTARTAITSAGPNDSASAPAVAAIPAGLCAASTSTTGLRLTISSRPGEVIIANASATRSASSAIVPRSIPPARPTPPAPVPPARPAPVPPARPAPPPPAAASSGAPDTPSGAPEPPAADRQLTADHAELDTLPGHRGTDLGRPTQQLGRRLDRLLPEHRDGAWLDDPGLVRRDRRHGVAEVLGVVDGDRGDHGHGSVGHVGVVPGAAHPDLDHGHVHRRVGERGERHRNQHLEERQRDRLAVVDQPHVGLDLGVDLDEPLGAQRLGVHADPLAHRDQVRAGEQPRAQAARVEQGLHHPRRRGLAVGPGHVDHRVRALRVAEQAGQLPDPVQRRVDRVLGTAGQDLPLDLAQPRLDVSAHWRASGTTVTARPARRAVLPAARSPPARWPAAPCSWSPRRQAPSR